MEDFLTFRRNITPGLIMLIYTIGAFQITGLAVLFVYYGAQPCSFGICLGYLYIILGIITLIFGNLAWRLLCEYFVVQFRIYDALQSIDKKISLREMQRTRGTSGATSVDQTVDQGRRSFKCENCGTENRSTVKYCTSCGATLPARTISSTESRLGQAHKFCGECGAKMPATWKFCGKCGTKFEPVEGRPMPDWL